IAKFVGGLNSFATAPSGHALRSPGFCRDNFLNYGILSGSGTRSPLGSRLNVFVITHAIHSLRSRSVSKIAFLFPGQGAQHVGMGKVLAEKYPAARALYDRAAEILGYDLAKICFEGPNSQLDTTAISQPAIFVTSLAALEKLRADSPDVLLSCEMTA